jgi:hypothetical protein
MIQKFLQLPKFLQFASITKKITLALIGLFLVLFLLVHLGINLCMLRSDNGDWFRAAAHFMGTNYIVIAFEFVLFGAILLHISLALFIQIHNWRSRPIGYKACNKSKTAFGSKLMIWSGILVLLFFAVHFTHFFFAKLGWTEGRYVVKTEAIIDSHNAKQQALSRAFANAQTEGERAVIEQEFSLFQERLMIFQTNEKLATALQTNAKYIDDLSRAEMNEIIHALDGVSYKADFYVMAKQLFKHGWVVILYLLFMTALGFHLSHAIPSAFQTLGLTHSKYTPIIKIGGTAFGVFIAVAFAIIPVFFYFFK